MKAGKKTPLSNLTVCLVIVAILSIACAGYKKPWRDYSKKPFSSAEWLNGDKIERGRMTSDMFRNSNIDIGTRDAAIKTLGEPDLKKTIEKNEVWFYRVDIGVVGARDVMPISFDEKGRSTWGMVKGGTMSMVAKESEL